MFKLLFLSLFINLLGFSLSQQCNPNVVEWFPHQYSCTKYVLCYHGNPIERPCAPGLHFSHTVLKCMFPIDARCDENYSCPDIDDVDNPIFLPDRIDCQRYFVCFNGSPIGRGCASGLWWDINNEWCTIPEEVTCDSRTSNNPGGSTTTVATTESTTVVTEAPNLSICSHIHSMFDPQTGLYVKSSCIVRSSSIYAIAEQVCNESNMNLFIIDNSFVQSTLFTTTSHSLSDYALGYVWLNGRRESSGNWFSFSPDRRPLYDAVDWVESPVNGRNTGDCLMYTQEHTGNYLAMGFHCSSSSFFTCEFFSKPVLNTESCLHQSPLFDEDGNYLKTSCIINALDTYFEAERRCIENGMTLFVINNSTVQTSLFESTTEALVDQPRGFLWVNGRRDGEEWFVESPRRESLYSGVDWVETENVNGRTSGDCLRYSQEHGPYRALGQNCDSQSWVICEY